MLEAALGAVGGLLLILVALVLKRLSDLDAKLDKHIDESASVRGDVMMLKDRWDFYWRRPNV